MPTFRPIKRKDLIYYLMKAGFESPVSGGKHQYMVKGDITLRIPNPHESDISINLLHRILKQAHISRQEWEEL